MRKKEPYETATMLEKTTAIELEARRLKTTYAKLVHELQNDGRRECEIINAYIIAKQSRQERKLRQCEGCVYNVQDRIDGRKYVCSFHQTGRLRRKDAEGDCLEYTTKKERRRDAPTKFQRLLSGDWQEKTVAEIARELDTRESHVHQMLSDARRKNGVDIAFKRTRAGRKATGGGGPDER